MIKARFNIDPVAWQRPRFNGKRGFTAPVVKKFENTISLIAKSMMTTPPLQGALKVIVNFYLVPPKTVKKYYPFVRPDIDNFLKGVFDSLNGIFWIDDGQICELQCGKYYEWIEGKGRIEIEVIPMQDFYAVPNKTRKNKVLP